MRKRRTERKKLCDVMCGGYLYLVRVRMYLYLVRVYLYLVRVYLYLCPPEEKGNKEPVHLQGPFHICCCEYEIISEHYITAIHYKIHGDKIKHLQVRMKWDSIALEQTHISSKSTASLLELLKLMENL